MKTPQQGRRINEDWMCLGQVPWEEECQQVGTPTYSAALALAECKRYIEAIRQTVGKEPYGARLEVTINPHDFGDYYDVVCYYHGDNREAEEYAIACEGCVSRWPEVAA